MLPQVRTLFATDTPPAVEMMCSQDGTVWLQQFDPSEDPTGHGNMWVSVSSDGLTRRIDMPHGFRPMQTRADTLFGIFTADDGSLAIAIARAPR
jgi:hypothetical protein